MKEVKNTIIDEVLTSPKDLHRQRSLVLKTTWNLVLALGERLITARM
jgi:hypothetical protein